MRTSPQMNPAGATLDVKAKPGRSMLMRNSHSWHATLELLLMITSREITIRYKQSVMGFLWALFMPAMIVAAGLVVRAALSRVAGTALAADVVAAMSVKALPWAFFVSAVRLATNSLTANSTLVTRARCPRIVFPMSAVLSALFDLAIAAVPLIVVLAAVGTPISAQLLWVVPLLALLVMLVAGVGTALATANLFYRDVKYIVEVVLMFAIFFTPVLFEARILGDWQRWIWLNPLTPIFEGLYSVVVLARPPEIAWVGYSTLVTALVAIGAGVLFHRLEPAFADNI
jgi:lipopolysaccharide transport system permease protein